MGYQHDPNFGNKIVRATYFGFINEQRVFFREEHGKVYRLFEAILYPPNPMDITK